MKSYVTLLSTDSFLPGVLTLWRSLKDVNALFPLVVVINNKISTETKKELSKRDIEYIEYESVPYSEDTRKYLVEEMGWREELLNVSDKLHVFDLTQYDKIVYLDSDILVLKNIDYLFKYPHGSAASDGMEIVDTPYQQNFNAGVIVIEPNHEEYLSLLEKMKDYRGNEQDMLREYWSDWKLDMAKHLPVTANVLSIYWPGYFQKNLFSIQDVEAVHYICSPKPFQIKEFDLRSSNHLLYYWYYQKMIKAFNTNN